MNTGYIKLYRKTLENPVVCKDADHLIVWIYLLLNATHQALSVIFDGKKIILNPGQLITSTISISQKFKINKDKVQRILKSFENDKQINQQPSSKGRLITVLNWDRYQASDEQNDKQVINNCETSDKQLITNNNVRNNYYHYLEKIYARTISIVEIEMLDYLLDTYDNRLVIAALKNSCINNVKKLSYVKKTLINWVAEGKTIKDLQNEESTTSDVAIELFDYNWLEDEDSS